MNIAIVGFTIKGSEILRRLQSGLSSMGHEVEAVYPLDEPLSEWTRCHFKTGSGLIFVGAVGIAVRSVAPFLMGKDKDPAVVVVDEQGSYSISLLSGHLGGANDLAMAAANVLRAIPIITTATDLNHKFAVDLFAKKNRFAIMDFTVAKEISAAVLKNQPIGFFSDFPIEGELPRELVLEEEQKINISVTVKHDPLHQAKTARVLRLVPPAVVLGIGCRKGTSADYIEKLVSRVLKEKGIEPSSVGCIASIDLKQSEQGLMEAAGRYQAEFITFSAEELEAVEGSFTESEFVRQVTGVSNVCERACLCACGGFGHLIVEKTAEDGVTVAVALKDQRVHF